MVIAYLYGGLGNQFYIYAAGRLIAQKLNTEFKMDISNFGGRTRKEHGHHTHAFYELCEFNIQENFAMPEEIKHVKESGLIMKVGEWSAFENFKGDIFIPGFLFDEKYLMSAVPLLRKEFTLKKPMSTAAETCR